MKLKLFIVLSFVVSINKAQPLFQNVYGEKVSNHITIASSPDAYYLLHNPSSPPFIPELVKVDLNGQIKWTKTIFPSGSTTTAFKIIYNNNALLLTATSASFGPGNVLCKLDTAGTILWASFIGYSDININSRIHSFGGGYLVVGTRDYVGTGSNYTYDITLAQTDASGNFLWGKAYGDNTYDFLVHASVPTSNGDLIVAGSYGLRVNNQYSPMLARFDNTGNLLWMKTFSDTTGFFTSFRPTDITNTSDGNFVLTGFSENTNFNYDAHVIKIDGNGNILWAKRPYQIGWQEYGKTIIEDSQNHIVVAGPYNLNTDYGDFISRYDLNGNFIDAIKIAHTVDDTYFLNVIYNSVGEDIVERLGTGYAYSTLFEYDPFTFKQCLVTTNYNGTLGCSSMEGTYPFTVQNVQWYPVNFTSLPGFATLTGNITVFTDSLLTDSAENICYLTGLNEITKAHLAVFPNPVKNEMNMTGLFVNGDELKIMDEEGREIMHKQISFNTTKMKMEIKNLKEGFYFIEVKSKDSHCITKFIKVN